MISPRPGRLSRWALPLTLASIAATACFQSSDGDLGFHLATGREILATGRIPATNVLSYTHPEHPWLLHQWLPATLFELLFRSGGIAAVLTLKMALTTAIFALLFLVARTLGATAYAAGAACLCAAMASSFRFEARPLLFSQLALALSMLTLAHAFRDAHPDGSLRRAPLLVLAAICAVAAQLHAGAVYSWLAIGAAAIGCASERLRPNLLCAPSLSPDGARPALGLAAAAIGAALLAAGALQLYHPVGARILSFPFDMATDAYLSQHVIELRPAWRFPPSYLAGFWVLLAASAASAIALRRSTHAAWNVIWLPFAALALKNVRMVFPFAVVAVPLLSLGLSRIGSFASGRSAPLVLCLLALMAPLESWRKIPPGFGFAAPTWPLAHFEQIRSLRLSGHIFASDAWAGPMLGFFYPSRRAFYDGRIDAYPREFVHLYQDIRYGKPGWDKALDRYDVQVVLLRYTTAREYAFQNGKDNLRQLLARDPRWALLFFDDFGELFARRDGMNRSQATLRAIDGVDPDRRRFVARPRASADALMRALSHGARPPRMLGMAALAVADTGQARTAVMLLSEARTRAPDDPWLAGIEARFARALRVRTDAPGPRPADQPGLGEPGL